MNVQGGNRISTSRDASFAKWDTGYLRYAMAQKTNAFSEAWHGFGAHAAMWDLGDSGNWHLFKTGSTIPAGDYVIKINADWNAKSD